MKPKLIDLSKNVAERFARTLQAMQRGGRMPAAHADFLIQQVQDLLACR
jgi:hypothetical protein